MEKAPSGKMESGERIDQDIEKLEQLIGKLKKLKEGNSAAGISIENVDTDKMIDDMMNEQLSQLSVDINDIDGEIERMMSRNLGSIVSGK